MNKPTMADVAKAAGVSKNTVSLTLRNDARISESTRRRVAKIADELGYRRDPLVCDLMSHLKRTRQGDSHTTFALVNANQDPDAFRNHPTIPVYVEGAIRRGNELGYRFDSFWMHDPGMNGKALARIFGARGIQGVLIVGMMKQSRLPVHFLPVVQKFPCVVTGLRTRSPALSFACVDHHMLTRKALEEALALGYERPGLVIDPVIDDLVEGRFTAGYFISQRHLPKPRRLQPFFDVAKARDNPAIFLRWLEKEKPDVIFTLYSIVRRWIEEAGLRIPEDIGLVQLEWRQNQPDWAGMNQHNDIVGEAALEMLASLAGNRDFGIPKFPRATLIGSTWVNGDTVRQQA